MISARSVDPRDDTQEVEQPTYRVTFWSAPPLPPGVPSSMQGWASSEWDVEGRAAIWLLGNDPTASSPRRPE